MIFERLDAASEIAEQLGALCWRIKNGKVRILLITSRETGRWVIPKGWPMTNVSPHNAAYREAWEEAGVIGKPDALPIGTFAYDKIIARGRSEQIIRPCTVFVFPVKVEKLARNFPERKERKRKWFSPKRAAAQVDEPELATIIASFNPVDA